METQSLIINIQPQEYIALCIHVPNGKTSRDVLKEYVGSLPENTIVGHASDYFLKIETPCGHIKVYPTLDDVPLVDTPCPCGNPNHYLIKILNTGEQS